MYLNYVSYSSMLMAQRIFNDNANRPLHFLRSVDARYLQDYSSHPRGVELSPLPRPESELALSGNGYLKAK